MVLGYEKKEPKLFSQYRPRYRVFLWPVTSVSAYRISAFRSTERKSMQLSKLWCNVGTGDATPPSMQAAFTVPVRIPFQRRKGKLKSKKNNYNKKDDNDENIARNIIISRYPILSQF